MFRVLGIHNFALRLNLHFFFQHSQTGVTALMAVSGHGDLDTIHDLLRYHTYITQSLVGESQKGQKMAIFAYFQYKT